MSDIFGRLFYLGAGFSQAAGIPLTESLLAEVMQEFRRAAPGLCGRVTDYARTVLEFDEEPDYSTIGFSRLCTFLDYIELREYTGGERWDELGCRELMALRHYIAKVIAAHTPAPDKVPDLYVQFASQLTDRDLILTFNWDCLLENAIEAAGKRVSYQRKEGCISIVKMHGSINWTLARTNLRSLAWRSLTDDSESQLSRVLVRDDLRHGDWGQWSPWADQQPYLVLPGYGKALSVRHLAEYWYRPEQHAALYSPKFIIGLGLAPDDFFLKSLFLHTLQYRRDGDGAPVLTIINPGERAREEYAFALKSPLVELLPESFGLNHLSLFS